MGIRPAAAWDKPCMSVPLMTRMDTYEPGVVASSVCPCPPPMGGRFGIVPGSSREGCKQHRAITGPFSEPADWNRLRLAQRSPMNLFMTITSDSTLSSKKILPLDAKSTQVAFNSITNEPNHHLMGTLVHSGLS